MADDVVGVEGGRAGLDAARSNLSGAARKARSLRGFGPVKEIGGVGEAHLVGLIGGSAEPVHPIFAVDLLGNNGAGFCPAFVPISFVGGKDPAFALPVEQVARTGEAKLRVLFVVAGVGEGIGVTEFLDGGGS